MEQVRLCVVWPKENRLGSSLNQIQGWTTVREPYSRALEQGPLMVPLCIGMGTKRTNKSGNDGTSRRVVDGSSEDQFFDTSYLNQCHSKFFASSHVYMLHVLYLHRLPVSFASQKRKEPYSKCSACIALHDSRGICILDARETQHL